MKENEMEKLIGEITDKITEVCDVNEYDVPLERVIEWAIARVLKAVIDGLPLPGEVGRCSRIGIPPSPEFEDWIQHVIEYHHSGLVIALCPEEER